MELIRRIKGKPKDPPRAVSFYSEAYVNAQADLDAANRAEDWWYSLLCKPNGAIFPPNRIVEAIFDIRRQEINALWRLGRDSSAARRQADLDERLSR